MTSHRWAVFVIKYIWEDLPPLVFLHRELLPVCCTESYSRSVAPRAVPDLLHRELSMHYLYFVMLCSGMRPASAQCGVPTPVT